MNRKELSIAIIGGGIGGLTAALSLLQAGLDVHVYEQARTISEVGAGIAVGGYGTDLTYYAAKHPKDCNNKRSRRWADTTLLIFGLLGLIA